MDTSLFLTEQVTSIVVRHLPNRSPAEIEALLKQFGATDVRVMSSTAMRGTAFASFPDQTTAAQALERLNGLTIDDRQLTAEYCRPPSVTSTEPGIHVTPYGAPVAPELGLYYPAPPHLHYLYPPPNPHILRNILTAIVAVPKLYTQVLHLMNKMNLPPPFEDKEWAPPSHPMVEAVMARDKTTTQAPPAPPAPAPAAEKRKRDELLSSDESEIVSEEESTRPVTIQQIRRRR